jgi:hypothetical protein
MGFGQWLERLGDDEWAQLNVLVRQHSTQPDRPDAPFARRERDFRRCLVTTTVINRPPPAQVRFEGATIRDKSFVFSNADYSLPVTHGTSSL